MGVSTNGQICFGIKFNEGHEFPWDAEEFEGDMEGWWREVNGYKPPFELWDEKGDYLPSVELIQPPPERRWEHPRPKQEVIDAYYGPRREWDKANPLPVTLVNYCSGDCPMYILAAAGTCHNNNRGYPEEITADTLALKGNERQVLKEFCERFGIKASEEPKWWLSSYWG